MFVSSKPGVRASCARASYLVLDDNLNEDDDVIFVSLSSDFSSLFLLFGSPHHLFEFPVERAQRCQILRLSDRF
jgi:hypothetical protein